MELLLHDERQSYETSVTEMMQQLTELKEELNVSLADRNVATLQLTVLRHDLDKLSFQLTQVTHARDSAMQSLQTVYADWVEMKQAADKINDENKLSFQLKRVTQERDSALQSLQTVYADRVEMKQAVDMMAGENKRLATKLELLVSEKETTFVQLTTVKKELHTLRHISNSGVSGVNVDDDIIKRGACVDIANTSFSENNTIISSNVYIAQSSPTMNDIDSRTDMETLVDIAEESADENFSINNANLDFSRYQPSPGTVASNAGHLLDENVSTVRADAHVFRGGADEDIVLRITEIDSGSVREECRASNADVTDTNHSIESSHGDCVIILSSEIINSGSSLEDIQNMSLRAVDSNISLSSNPECAKVPQASPILKSDESRQNKTVFVNALDCWKRNSRASESESELAEFLEEHHAALKRADALIEEHESVLDMSDLGDWKDLSFAVSCISPITSTVLSEKSVNEVNKY